MTLRKSVGIGVTGIIFLSAVIVVSFALVLFKLEDLGKKEMDLIEVNDHLNRGYFELIAWMSEISDHIFDDWPFEGNLDYRESLLGKWFEEHGSTKAMSDENKKMVEDFASNTEALFHSAARIVKAGDIELKKEIYFDEFQSYAHAIEPLVGGITNFYQAKLAGIREKRINLQKNIGYFIIVAASITIISMLFAALAIFKGVLKPLHHISREMIAVGRGDLRVSVNYEKNNEIGDIARNFNKMVVSFRDIVNGILTSSGKVVSTVDVLREMAKKTAEGAQNQHNQTTQAATATEEMSQTITEIAQNAAMAAESSSAAIETADKGREVADGAVETINQVYTSTIGLATEIEKLNKSVSEIGEIVTVINGIADQTNLLALNAAIEAARAGEQGRGFAVVADEVRKLAENTIKATADISEKIGMVQKESEQTTRSMEESSGEVTKATDYIKNLGSSLHSIVESVQKVRDEVTHIATAVDEQSSAAGEVSSSIEQTAIISNEVEKMSEEVLREVNNLTRIAEELKNSTAGFRTGEDTEDSGDKMPGGEPAPELPEGHGNIA
ncbi:MAG: methyl-accepting chemotaxis protein [Deferribacteres bacterium]|nr:methyl-accepting chemotaxis protein [Deferribacteres bacterium]